MARSARRYLGAVVVALALDAAYALLANTGRVPSSCTSLLQIAFYAGLGWFVAARTGRRRTAILVVMLAALVDASFGTALYTAIATQRPFAGTAATLVLAAAVTFVMLSTAGAIAVMVAARSVRK